jgi:hypothetical protein
MATQLRVFLPSARYGAPVAPVGGELTDEVRRNLFRRADPDDLATIR